MKKWMILVLVILVVFGMTGCQSKETPSVNTDTLPVDAAAEAEIRRAKWKNYRLRYFTNTCEEVISNA